MSIEISYQAAEILLKIKAVTLSPQKPYRYTSGILSPIYTDNRIICSYVQERAQIRRCYEEIIKENKLRFDIIGGIATGGIPHAAWLADILKAPLIYVRSAPKEHGKGKQVEGKLEQGQRVLIIEDLISTGKSSISAITGVRNEGGIVTDVIGIFTYQMKKAQTVFTEAGVRLFTLTNFTDLVTYAAQTGYIQEKDLEIILEWNTDPQAWTEKREQIESNV